MNYQEMWEVLKVLIEDNIKWYQGAIAQSVEESIYRKQECKEILRHMRSLEKAYRNKDDEE